MTHPTPTLRTALFHLAAAGLVASLFAGCDDAAPAPEAEPTATPASALPSAPTPDEQPLLAATAPAAAAPSSARLEGPSGAELSAPEEVAPRGPELRRVGDVAVRRMALSRWVEAREPVDPDDVFTASSDRLYAFFDVRNDGEDEAYLSVTFEGPAGRSTGHVELSVPAGAPRWRTWAWTRHATEPGTWQAVLRDEGGALLARHDFVVE